MSYHDENLTFIQKKIAEIRIALFKADIKDDELPIPNNVVSTIKTDSPGNIWFYTTCTGDYAGHVLDHFYAYLDFYQKGNAYRLRVEGEASVVKDGSILTKARNCVLIQMKIQHAAYYENKFIHNSSPSFKTRLRDFFYELLFSHKAREFNFN